MDFLPKKGDEFPPFVVQDVVFIGDVCQVLLKHPEFGFCTIQTAETGSKEAFDKDFSDFLVDLVFQAQYRKDAEARRADQAEKERAIKEARLKKQVDAKMAWESGASLKDIAEIMGHSFEYARLMSDVWAKETAREEVRRAAEFLIENGFSRSTVQAMLRLAWAGVIKSGNEDPSLFKIFLSDVGTRAANALLGEGCESIEDVCAMTEVYMGRIPNCGKNTINKIKHALADRGWFLAQVDE